MDIFGETGSKVTVWGPVTTMTVSIEGFSPAGTDEWALVAVQLNAEEVVDVRRCFNDETFLYALGNDQDRCRVRLTFVVFLSGKNCDAANAFNALKDGVSAYVRNRISKKQKEKKITMGKFSVYGWLDGLTVGGFDASKGICYATVDFMMKLPEAQ